VHKEREQSVLMRGGGLTAQGLLSVLTATRSALCPDNMFRGTLCIKQVTSLIFRLIFLKEIENTARLS
jgi:hypothetical protein